MRESQSERTFAVDGARLQFVLRGQPVSLASTFSLGLITVALMWSSVPHSVLIGWLAVLLIVTAMRATLWILTRSSYFSRQPIAFWRALFISGCALSGSCWGAASLLFETSDPLLTTFMAVVIAGTAAGSVTSLASDRWAAFALVLPCVLPFIITRMLSDSYVDMAIGFVALLFLATIGGSVYRFHTQLSLMMTARAELQLSQAEMAILNERMKLAANSAKVGFYEWNLVTSHAEWDAQVYALLDLDPAAGPATLDAWRARIHPADLSDVQSRFDVLLKNGREFDVEFRVVSRDHVVRDIRSRGIIERNDKGKLTKMVGLVMDVTELRRLDRMKQEFISIVSHELRTPLTSIRGALGLLSSNSVNADKGRQLVELANRNAERLSLLIDDILDMDKIESGEMRFDIGSRNLHDLVSQAIATNMPYAERLGVTIKQHPNPMHLHILVDSNRFLQVMTNLLSNAAKYSPPGQAVEVTTHIEGNNARVSVRDHGPGIPSEFHSKLFGKFCQGDSSDSRVKPGSGLGLAISKAIIETMQGSIGFTTAPNEGTTFYFDLPVAEEKS